jgi:alkanesulfonate monooxygenase SsuD/methylene tetrahydromethanopterin reductase-like flavin-dependent oxidoreductase (luciferase family)
MQNVVIGLVTGKPGRLAAPVDRLEPLPEPIQQRVDAFLSCSFIGSPATVKAELTKFAEETRADELMVATAVFDPAARIRSAELLARAWFGSGAG